MIWVTSTKTIVGKYNVRTSYGTFTIDSDLAELYGLKTKGIKCTYLTEYQLNQVMKQGRQLSPTIAANF